MRAISVQDFNPNIHIYVAALTVEMRQRLVKVNAKGEKTGGENAKIALDFFCVASVVSVRFRTCFACVLCARSDAVVPGNYEQLRFSSGLNPVVVAPSPFCLDGTVRFSGNGGGEYMSQGRSQGKLEKKKITAAVV